MHRYLIILLTSLSSQRPAIEEVIAGIDLIAHGQFGNWCIQHLCEHGSPPDKRRVIDHILANAYSYCIDQFASKVVEKCLKIGGPEFMERYLAVVTTAHPERPRIPLIDSMNAQIALIYDSANLQ